MTNDTKIDEADKVECMRDSEVMPRESVNKQMRQKIYLEDKTGRAVIKGISGEGYTPYIRADIADELLEALAWFIDDIDGTRTVMTEFDTAVENARKAIKKARA